MTGTGIRITASEGGAFDCYLSAPAAGPATGVILASAVHGVDEDLRATADRFADAGLLVAAPDLFWRTDPGPTPRTEEGARRSSARSQPRAERIFGGLPDLADTAAMLRARPDCNGRIAAVGFCYGGPYAILGQTRLGFDAGMACHGTELHHYLAELKLARGPLSLHWGDQDHIAPPDTLKMIQDAIGDMPAAEVRIYPGVKHGFTAPSSPAWNASATEAAIGRIIEVLQGLGARSEAAE